MPTFKKCVYIEQMVNGAGRGHLHGLQAGRELHAHQDIREGRHQLQRSPGDWGTQCCGTVTIFYGSGSDFWKVTVPVPAPTIERLRFPFRFRFWFRLMKSYGPSYGSGSVFRSWRVVFNMKIFFLLNLAILMFIEADSLIKKHNFIPSLWELLRLFYYGSGNVINHSSGSNRTELWFRLRFQQKVTVPTVPVPVPQHCLYGSSYRFGSPLFSINVKYHPPFFCDKL